MLLLLLACVAVAVRGVTALYEDCDYFQELQPDQAYYIYSPNHPDSYKPGTSCRWFAVAPPGSQIYLTCEDMKLPKSKECSKDHVGVSVTGDEGDIGRYCGTGGFSAVSSGSKMLIQLISSRRSRGGAFLCSIGVQPGSEPEEQCECGWKNTVRIVGGTNTRVNEYPMMAGLIDGVKRNLFCGATIISRRFAVTAAHCLINKRPRGIGLLVGDYDTSRGNDTDAARLLLIDQFKVHPEYNSVTQVNDIAIVRTEMPIEFGLRVGPVCLPFANYKQNFAGEKVQALGWGTKDFGGIESSQLQKVDLKVLTTAQCQRAYKDLVSNNNICTYEKDKDACQSDSGGPILWEEPQTRRVKLLGIISYGIQCATENPGVNTRVTQYLSWIMQNADDDYCVK